MRVRSAFITVMLLILLVPAAHAQRVDGRTHMDGAGTRAPVGGGNPPVTSVRDGGFEDSYEAAALLINDDWKVDDSLFGSPLCLAGACGEKATYGAPRSGTHWVYFGAASAAETGFIQQKVILPDTAYLHLEYYVWVSFVGVQPTVTVSVDSTVVDTIPVAATTGDYVSRIVDLSAYADGRAHKIRFSYSKPAGGFADVNIDDISLYKGGNISIFDPGFETGSEFWTVANQTGDKVKCNTDLKTFSHSGNCAFRFKGGVGENSKLEQGFGVLRSVPPVSNRAPPAFAVYLGAFVNAPASVRGTMKLKLTLTDSSKVKTKVSLSGRDKYKWLQTPYVSYPSEQGIIAILIGVIHKSESGKTYIDDFEIFQVEDYPEVE